MLWVVILLGASSLWAQSSNPYILNGDASQNNCNCYTLTQDKNFQHGSVWNKNLINLHQSFNYYFNVFLGCNYSNGADGIAFVLQPLGTNIGSAGGGLGYEGIKPSVAVTIDTYQNSINNDPNYDHITIATNGIITHGGPSDLAGPVQALVDSPDIKDCKWHVLQVQWDAVGQNITVSLDGVQRLAAHDDIINNIFGGNPTVYWGFTGSTGGATDLQEFCTSLNAQFNLKKNTNFCLGTPVNFVDQSTSFGSIVQWYWDFGDGSYSNSPNPPPHQYAQPGIYPTKLAIEGNNGCESDTFNYPLTIGTYPIAAYSTLPLCTGHDELFKDTSSNQVGKINQWNWNIGNGAFVSGQKDPVFNFTKPGTYSVSYSVNTEQNCPSDTLHSSLTVNSSPVVAWNNPIFSCWDQPVLFQGTQLDQTTRIQSWNWSFGDGGTAQVPNPTHTYSKGGFFPFSLFALADNGCPSDTLMGHLQIQQLFPFAGNDTMIAQGQPLQLNASGGTYYSWTPPGGLSNPGISNPVATLQQNMTYLLKVSSQQGCSGYDTLTLKVYKGPAFYIPTAFSPNGDGMNDLFRPIPIGMKELSFFRVFNRWGQQVFYTQTFNQGWNGRFQGKNQPIGTYVWEILGTDDTGKRVFRTGVVTLIR
ncbi:MAG: lectin-like domain-containing protein [Chitinophagaceae bacterium]